MKYSCILILYCIGHFCYGQTVQYGKNPSVGKYAKVNGISMYYEIYGSGPPLVLLHGNGGSIAGRGAIMPQLIEKYKVIAIDSRCHGKSGCSKELNYELMASDVNALLNQLKIDSTFIYGHSDGGIIGLIMAFTYPAKVKKLVVSGANITPDKSALEPALVDMARNYKRIPDTLMQKQAKLMVYHPNIDFATLTQIKAPVMVMSGDRDAIVLEHSIKIFRAIPNSNLCILPASTHFIVDEKPTMLLYWLNEFFLKKFSKPSTVELAIKYYGEPMGLIDK